MTAGGRNANIANDHTLTVHARMPMTTRAGFLALVTVNTLVKVNHQNFGSLDHSLTYQRTQSSACLCIGKLIYEFGARMRKGVEKSCLRCCGRKGSKQV